MSFLYQIEGSGDRLVRRRAFYHILESKIESAEETSPGEGLQPTSKGARVKFSGKKRTVIAGPFAETNELICGFWMWQLKSKEEAIEWVKRYPNPA